MEQQITTEKARQGATPNRVRYVLAVGTALAVACLGGLYLFYFW